MRNYDFGTNFMLFYLSGVLRVSFNATVRLLNCDLEVMGSKQPFCRWGKIADIGPVPNLAIVRAFRQAAFSYLSGCLAIR